ncbi:MAG: hypothetical protein GAK37_00088 [Pseudomonas sp.]|nr:MAG: hypothetical protein GAK37_00088 [Pseudomonas sp.]
MNQQDPEPSNAFRYFVVGVLCVAVVLAVYFVRLNARVDRERDDAAERLTLCRQVDSAALAAGGKVDRSALCQRLIERYSPKPADPPR